VERRRLGGTDLELSVIGLGGHGEPPDRED